MPAIGALSVSTIAKAHGEALFAKISELDFESIVAKQSEFRVHGRTAARMDQDEESQPLWRKALRYGDE